MSQKLRIVWEYDILFMYKSSFQLINAIISNYLTTEKVSVTPPPPKKKQDIRNICAIYNFLIAVFISNPLYLDTISLFKLLKPTGYVMHQQV